jgi:hypothetical protein
MVLPPATTTVKASAAKENDDDEDDQKRIRIHRSLLGSCALRAFASVRVTTCYG